MGFQVRRHDGTPFTPHHGTWATRMLVWGLEQTEERHSEFLQRPESVPPTTRHRVVFGAVIKPERPNEKGHWNTRCRAAFPRVTKKTVNPSRCQMRGERRVTCRKATRMPTSVGNVAASHSKSGAAKLDELLIKTKSRDRGFRRLVGATVPPLYPVTWIEVVFDL